MIRDIENLLNARRAYSGSLLNATPPTDRGNLLNAQRAQRAAPFFQPLSDIWGKLEQWGLVNSPDAPMETISRPDASMADKLNAMSQFNFVGNVQNVGKPVAELLGDAVQGIKAYHGSPHDFDKFDLSKIGTGEGAQAYGHGLYFAENEGVAKSYRDALSTPSILNRYISVDGKTYRDFYRATDPEATGAKTLLLNNNDKAAAIKQIDDVIASGDASYDWKKVREFIENARGPAIHVTPEAGGKMYEVNIKADPSTFLDWDKPLSEQPQAVRTALSQRGIKYDDAGMKKFDDALFEALNGDASTKLPSEPWNPDAPNIYKTAMQRAVIDAGTGSWQSGGVRAGAPAASAWLKDAGIPGIKYLDQGSRGSGQGTSNYVVFDPSIVEILRKYGILAPLAGGLGFSNGDNSQ